MAWNAQSWKPLLRAIWVLMLLTVIVGSLLPAASPLMRELDAFELNDKLEHFAAYGGLAFLPALHETAQKLRVLLVLVLLMGIVLEFGQRLSPGRTYDVYDMLADAAGIAAGFVTALPLRALVRA